MVRNKILFAAVIPLLCGLLCAPVSLDAAPKVKTGLEVLVENEFYTLEGKRVGLVTNPTGVDSQLRSTIDILHESNKVKLVALFAPEHGVRGDIYAGAKV